MKSFIVACLTSATSLGVKFGAFNGGLGNLDTGFNMDDLTATVVGQIGTGFEAVGEANKQIADE